MAYAFIQAEFEHYPRSGSFKEVERDARERIAEGSRIKQVARFTDDTGKITSLIRRIADLQKHSDHLLYSKQLILFRNARSKRTAGKILSKRAHLLDLCQSRLGYAEVAVEDFPGAPFRKMNENERYELCVAASRADGVRAFIMEGELLGDTVKVELMV